LSYVALNRWVNKAISIIDVRTPFEAVHSLSLLGTVSVCCLFLFYLFRLLKFSYQQTPYIQQTDHWPTFFQIRFLLFNRLFCWTNSVVSYITIVLGIKSWPQSITTSTTYHHHRQHDHIYCHHHYHHHHQHHHSVFNTLAFTW
jgi:hypothetical protein